jgi:hypothetical protein
MIVRNLTYCDHCHSPVANGQRWVREKICDTGRDSEGPAYLRYHAEPFVGREGSCWEKHQIETEVARNTL